MDLKDLKKVFEIISKDPSDRTRDEKLLCSTGIEFAPEGPTALRHVEGLCLSGRVCCDSRLIKPGDVFVAVRGTAVDGHDFIDQALGNGARVVVAEQAVDVPEGVRLVQVGNSAAALGELAQVAAGNPAGKLSTMSVTGTNGKTTVAYLVRHICRVAGRRCGMIGTVEYDLGDQKTLVAQNTTPDGVQLAQMMQQMLQNQVEMMVMECSSHGLDQDRTAGIDFDAAAFTNLSGDHLDYHRDTESYLAAKGKLFSGLSEDAFAVLNAEDKCSERLAEMTHGRIWRFGIDKDVEVRAHIKRRGLWGSEFTLEALGKERKVRTALVGEHNVSNCLAAAGLTKSIGVEVDTIAEAIESFAGVPGRLERVNTEGEFTVLVDYAHTDDALGHVLQSLRKFTPARLILVFGCGGQRDTSKRPRMAQKAEEWADLIVVTNDNPRREDPQQILAHIRAGFSKSGRKKVTELPDRREAICYALEQAHKGDVILIAGKGHEDYQLVGAEKRHFDDREVAREWLSNH